MFAHAVSCTSTTTSSVFFQCNQYLCFRRIFFKVFHVPDVKIASSRFYPRYGINKKKNKNRLTLCLRFTYKKVYHLHSCVFVVVTEILKMLEEMVTFCTPKSFWLEMFIFSYDFLSHLTVIYTVVSNRRKRNHPPGSSGL